ncbi:MAG: aminotransferase class I/II-fold pyridoxal phosphate-dependent enzyme [Actinomycetota bacterium]
MRIDLFKMERAQCLYEKEVEYNLSESGVSPLRVEELLGDRADPAAFLGTKLGYPWSNGSPELRENVASFYEAEPGNVTVTNGSSEAIFIAFWGLLEKGDRAAIMIPTYMQTWGLARHFAGRADTYRMVRRRESGEWRWGLDVEGLRRSVTKRTKVILVTNPNNPTGAVLTEEEMDEVVRIARKANAWIVADEVYRGAELAGGLSPTFWGRYSKVLVVSGLSKAFGLPGLRIGWVTGPPKTVEKLSAYRDYTTLTPAVLSDRLATIAMEPGRREAILERTRRIVRGQFPRFEEWASAHDDLLELTPPKAGAIAYMKYKLPISSTKLFDKLRIEQSVLVTPADHFGMSGKYIRIGYGYDMEYTLKGLARISQTFEELRP